ncbi:MAG TPA: glycosyltransferase [Solirubrobacteraceae bacterium]
MNAVDENPEADFLSGVSGTVGGLDGARRELRDRLTDARELLGGRRARLDRAVRAGPEGRRVLALGVQRAKHADSAAAIIAELARSRHRVQLRFCPPGELGKFENLNRLLAREQIEECDWLLVVDDDVVLPHGFLDRLVFLAERFALDLAQPAHRARSHAAWQATRRQAGAVAHLTRFVEIGPVTAFARSTFSTLLPFPALRMGWGLDLHWAALAREHGWRCGVLDAVAIRHLAAPVASSYSQAAAIAEARAFLATRPYLSASEAHATLATYRNLRA